jgi:hypothetical protein
VQKINNSISYLTLGNGGRKAMITGPKKYGLKNHGLTFLAKNSNNL